MSRFTMMPELGARERILVRLDPSKLRTVKDTPFGFECRLLLFGERLPAQLPYDLPFFAPTWLRLVLRKAQLPTLRRMVAIAFVAKSEIKSSVARTSAFKESVYGVGLRICTLFPQTGTAHARVVSRVAKCTEFDPARKLGPRVPRLAVFTVSYSVPICIVEVGWFAAMVKDDGVAWQF